MQKRKLDSRLSAILTCKTQQVYTLIQRSPWQLKIGKLTDWSQPPKQKWMANACVVQAALRSVRPWSPEFQMTLDSVDQLKMGPFLKEFKRYQIKSYQTHFLDAPFWIPAWVRGSLDPLRRWSSGFLSIFSSIRWSQRVKHGLERPNSRYWDHWQMEISWCFLSMTHESDKDPKKSPEPGLQRHHGGHL